MKDEYGIVLDFLEHGHSTGRNQPTAQIIGEQFMNLLEVVVRKEVLLKLEKKSDFLPHLMYIFSLKFNQNDFGKKTVGIRKNDNNPELSVREILKITSENIEKFVEEISSGQFPNSRLNNREEKVCKYCEYRSVCRVNDMKNDSISQCS